VRNYRRHSALRTINGGICRSAALWLLVLTQLLLLGYQRMLNTLIFKGNLFFWDLLNIAKPLPYLRKPQLRYHRIGQFMERLLEIVQKLFRDASEKTRPYNQPI
jgi:hypothetical protein